MTWASWVGLILGVLSLLMVTAALGAVAKALKKEPPEPKPAEPPAWLQERSGRHMVIQMTTNHTLEGVLMHIGPDGLVLAGAMYLTDSGRTPLIGDTYLPREKVGFVQVPALPD